MKRYIAFVFDELCKGGWNDVVCENDSSGATFFDTIDEATITAQYHANETNCPFIQIVDVEKGKVVRAMEMKISWVEPS